MLTSPEIRLGLASLPHKALWLLWPYFFRFCRPMTIDAFIWMWAHRPFPDTSAFILFLLSAVKSSINGNAPIALAAAHSRAVTEALPCLTDKVLRWLVRCVCPPCVSSVQHFDSGLFLFHCSVLQLYFLCGFMSCDLLTWCFCIQGKSLWTPWSSDHDILPLLLTRKLPSLCPGQDSWTRQL